jgi:hypothetical protein
MFQHAVAAGYGPMLSTSMWQIGNEYGSNVASGTQCGQDMLK